ncbi:MAG: 50S ribosomal protein L6 [Desulfatiglans sp.]|jgi:large subunit ribosomal protein L6|nr:50S ribosomal protein L6 [Thermodesulfobacteriota bacterium]MEE4352554.1 50S ribosomal protein L6 [Desulfatiglans sp.]
MPRIGKKPIHIPKGVDIKLDRELLIVKGPKGELSRQVHPKVQIDMDGDQVSVSVPDNEKESKSLHGLFRVLVANMISGVTVGYKRDLEIVGVGYKAELEGRAVVFNLGYSHPVSFELPDGIDAKIEKAKITLSGIDKELLGTTAARIRGLREPEAYKGKGIRYANERVRRKAGKAGIK